MTLKVFEICLTCTRQEICISFLTCVQVRHSHSIVRSLIFSIITAEMHSFTDSNTRLCLKLKLTLQHHRQALTYTVNVIVSRTLSKITALLLQTTNRK